MTEAFPFAGGLPDRFIRTMAVSIGGLPKAELFEQVKSVRLVSPYAKRIMKHESFTTLPVKETILQIVLSPEDLGFTDRPTIAEMLDNERLAKWSSANLNGWRVELNPPEAGPHLAIQYRGQPQNEFLWIAMERIPGAGGRPFIFYLERNDEDMCSLDAHWTYPYALWRLDYLVSYRLIKTPETSL
jgi:hypothetical protein